MIFDFVIALAEYPASTLLEFSNVISDNAERNDSDNLMMEYRHLTDIGKHQNIIEVFGIGKLDGNNIIFP